MIVTRGEFRQVIKLLSEPKLRGLDTETTGLNVHGSGFLEQHGIKKSRLFSLIIAEDGIDGSVYYFNFNAYEGLDSDYLLPRSFLASFKPIFESRLHSWAIHNAKFDQAILENDDLKIKGKVYCTVALGRVEKNDRPAYDLDSLTRRCLKVKKDDKVKEYIKEHKESCTTKIETGDGDFIEIQHFERVPIAIIQPYAELDARLTLGLCNYQLDSIRKQDEGMPQGYQRKVAHVAENEITVTQTFFRMEQRGARIDREYAESCFRHEQKNYKKASEKFSAISGIHFQDGRKVLRQAFEKAGVTPPLTKKGNPSFRSEVLEEIDSPLAHAVLEYREAYKLAHTYYGNFLKFADSKGYIHANVRQGGTIHGRVSYSDPNLQNLPSSEDVDLSQPYLVRRCFIPYDDHFFLQSIDYKAMEFRVMLDYAGEKSLIDKIIEGHDPHAATRDEMGLAGKDGRAIAKAINFGLMYGMGEDKLARTLTKNLGRVISKKEAKELKKLYFGKLPNVETFMQTVIATARNRGYLINGLGRRVNVPRDLAYKGINYLISGTCADFMKLGMNKIDKFLTDIESKTSITVQVHDELLFNWHVTEEHLHKPVLQILEEVYPHKLLPLTTSSSFSFKSWADLEDGFPDGIRIESEKESSQHTRKNPTKGRSSLVQKNTASLG